MEGQANRSAFGGMEDWRMNSRQQQRLGATEEEKSGGSSNTGSNEARTVWEEMQRSAAASAAVAADLQSAEQRVLAANAPTAIGYPGSSLWYPLSSLTAAVAANNNGNTSSSSNASCAADLNALLLLRAQQQHRVANSSAAQRELQARLRAIQTSSVGNPESSLEASLLTQLAEAERLRMFAAQQAEQQMQLERARRTIEHALQHQRRLEGLAAISAGLGPLSALALLRGQQEEGGGADAASSSTASAGGMDYDLARVLANAHAAGAAGYSHLLLNAQAEQHQHRIVEEDAARSAAAPSVGTASSWALQDTMTEGNRVASLPPAAAAAKTVQDLSASPPCSDDSELPQASSIPIPPPLPPVEEGATPHYSERTYFPLGIDEDVNWLSERQCFIRSELLEVVQASHQEVLIRSSSKSVSYQQIGIRCRFCAHMHPDARAIRSSAYPSSIRQIYQSFTMMVRDHFGQCPGIPQDKKQRFIELKGQTSPSSSLSRQYWMYAAERIGMIDTEYGIIITPQTQAAAVRKPLFGTKKNAAANDSSNEKLSASSGDDSHSRLLDSMDQAVMSPFLYTVLDQVEKVYLLPSEQVGKRKAAPVGLMGFGCRYCSRGGRLGFCRVFPLNKRSLPTKVEDIYKHMKRCTLLPADVKEQVEDRFQQEFGAAAANSKKALSFADKDRDFMDQLWKRLDREGDGIAG